MVDRKQKKQKKRKNAERKKNQERERQKRKEHDFAEFRKTGTTLKPYLRRVGCDIPFYDYLDSYTTEFDRIQQDAIESLHSLVAVHEVPQKTLDTTDWKELGYGKLEQVFFSIPDRCADYVQSDAQANLCGSATFFRNQSGEMRSVVLVQNRTRGSKDISEVQYAAKLAVLVHEIGHVIDAESSINFKLGDETMDVVAAEVFAHVYALNDLSTRGIRASYNMLYEAIDRLSVRDGYVGEIGRGVMEQHERKQMLNWRDYTEDAADLIAQERGVTARTALPN